MSILWTPQQLELLQQHYANTTHKEIVAIIGKSKIACYQKAHELGLKKSKELLRSYAEVLAEAGKSHYFRKGHTPANKGKKMTDEQKQKLKPHTMFAKGNLPHNTLHDGAITVRADSNGRKYKYIRLAQGKWELLHRHIWQQQYGAIPKGYNVQFVDGDSLNCSIENLYLVSRSVQAQHNRNGGRLLPQELKETITLINQLKTKIKNYEKQNHRSESAPV